MRTGLTCWRVLGVVACATALCMGIGARLAAAQQTPPAVDADLLLVGGLLVDGSGQPGRIGDLAIRDGRIVAVGDFQHGEALQTIDCAGLIIAPGFIDLHSHSDRSITEPPTRANVNFVTQGCTTVVTGNCGSGPTDVGKYLADVDAAGAGTNVIHLVPHSSVRSQVFGRARRPPSDDELAQMKALVEQGMRDGAWGMSTGLIYVPGTYAETEELIELATVVGQFDGHYFSHIRGEGSTLIDAVTEAIRIGREGHTPVHIAHYKATGRSNWGGVRIAAQVIEDARAEGLAVTADQYPYIASSTSLGAMTLPSWVMEGGDQAMLARLRDPAQLPQIRAESEQMTSDRNRLVISSYRARPEWIGMDLEQIAAAEQKPVFDIVLEIQRHGGASSVSFGMDEADVRFAMTLPWVATASDGSAMLPSGDKPHPRSYGTFPRKIGHYALRERVISLEHAVRSASALPAEILGLDDRGYLRQGFLADVVVFDPEEIMDRATFDEPFQYSEGVEYVFVAGRPTLYRGTPTGALAGRAIRHPVPFEIESSQAAGQPSASQ